MKKRTSLVIVVIVTLFVSSCGLFTKTGPIEGMEIYVIADSHESRSIEGRGAIPESVQIAFTKVWFPTSAAFTSLKAANTTHDGGQIYVNVTTDFSGLDFYKALDRGVNDPYVFNTATSEPFTPITNPSYGAVYHGVLLETVYFQMNMPTYSIRWYQKDSGNYLAQDVLVDKKDGNGWKFAYLKRTTEFDFVYNGEHSEYELQNISSGVMELILRETRTVEDQYFENWYNQSIDIPNDYLWHALGVYMYDETHTLRAHYQAEVQSQGYQPLENLTLEQYFRLTKDVPNDANPTLEHIGESLAMGYWNENGGLLIKAELIAGYDADAYENPKAIEIFTEDENEAKLYKIEISFTTDNPDAFACGLGIDSLPNSLDADSTWDQIKNHVAAKNFVSLSPITGGKEIAFGWLDFNDVWQGEFSADAGE